MAPHDLIKLSVSKSATFASCKAKYKFSYIEKLPKKDWQHHHFGRFAHRVLELFHQYYIEGCAEPFNVSMGKAFNEAYQEYKKNISAADKQEVYDIIKVYLSQINKPDFDITKVLAVEKSFNLEIGENVILTGMIDRLEYENDMFHIIDYKTSKSKNYLKDDTLQLMTYAYVIYKENPDIKKVKVSYIMLRHNCEYLTKEFSLEEILSIKDIYNKYASDMLTETEFKPTVSPLCAYCDFANVCESGRNFISKRFEVGQVQWQKTKGKK